MPAVIDLNDLFVDLLKDIYYAEKKILKALPKMAKAVGKDSKLAGVFMKHLEQTEGQVDRLEKVFGIIGEKAKGKKCDAIEGLAAEADDLMKDVKCKATMTAGLLAGAQAVEHYEIARYGTLVEWAKLLGHDDAAELLEETLNEEKDTDQLLNEMAVDGINEEAMDAKKTREEDSHSRNVPKRRAA